MPQTVDCWLIRAGRGKGSRVPGFIETFINETDRQEIVHLPCREEPHGTVIVVFLQPIRIPDQQHPQVIREIYDPVLVSLAVPDQQGPVLQVYIILFQLPGFGHTKPAAENEPEQDTVLNGKPAEGSCL